MLAILTQRAWYDLRATAHAHGLPFHTRHTKAQAYTRLYHSLVHDGALRQRFKKLSDGERRALVVIQAAGGVLPLYLFKRRYGDIRIWRPWQADAPRQPWKQPVSIAEKLWYLGFVEIVAGRPDQVALPDEVLALLPPLPRPRPVTDQPIAEPRFSRDALCVGVAALLGALSYLDVRPLHGRWLTLTALRAINQRVSVPDSLAGVRSERQTGRLRFLHYLAEAAGLVAAQVGVLKPTVQAWGWLRQPPKNCWQMLWDALQADLQRQERLWDRYDLPPVTGPTWAVWWDQLRRLTPGTYALDDFVAAVQPHLPMDDDLADLSRALLAGPLAWAGVVAWERDRFAVLPGNFAPPQNATLLQHADHLDVTLPAYPHLAALVTCSAWAQVEGHTLRLDSDAVRRALETGSETLHIAATLADLIGVPLPASVLDQITAWADAARAFTLRKVVLLTARDPAALADLRSDWRLRPLLGTPLSPHHTAIPAGQVDDLLDKLARRGHSVSNHITPAASPTEADFSPEIVEYLWLAVRVYQKLGALLPPDIPIPAAARDKLTAHLAPGRADHLEAESEQVVTRLAQAINGKALPPPVVEQADPAGIQKAVQSAYEQRGAITIEYFSPARGEKTVRTIEPIMLYTRGDVQYVEAWCRLDGDTRTFRVDRILRIMHDGPGTG